MPLIKVAFIDSYPAFCLGLLQAFASEQGFTVVGQGASAADATTLARELYPDVLVVDAEIASNPSVIVDLLTASPRTKILLIGTSSDPRVIGTALQSGVRGYISRRSTLDELVYAVRCVHHGERYVTPALAMKLLASPHGAGKAAVERFAKLTDREDQILDLLGIGLSNKEIGWRLTISEKTVKHYLTSILSKLNVQNRVQAALLVAGRNANLNFC